MTVIACQMGDGDDMGGYRRKGKGVNARNLKHKCDVRGQMYEHVKRG